MLLYNQKNIYKVFNLHIFTTCSFVFVMSGSGFIAIYWTVMYLHLNLICLDLKMWNRHLSRLFIGLTARQEQVTAEWFPFCSNRSTKKSHISITAPSGAIKRTLNDSPHFPPPLPCDARRSLVFSYYNSYAWTSRRKKRCSNIRESQSTLAAGTMIQIQSQSFMHSYPLTSALAQSAENSK